MMLVNPVRIDLSVSGLGDLIFLKRIKASGMMKPRNMIVVALTSDTLPSRSLLNGYIAF